MISMSWRSGVSGTMQYFDTHLSQGDYYIEQDESHTLAEWVGQGAERLGLKGYVKRDDFEAITKGVSPTGEKLAQRLGENRRTWWDVAISPPKDVSVLAALSDDGLRQQIYDAHWQASLEAAKELESFLGVRIRGNGQDFTHVGNMEAVVAAVLHDTSRPVDGVPDPHLHTHVLIANAVYDRHKQQWSAMANDGAVKAQQYVRQFYYSSLVEKLQGLGIQTQARESQKDFIIPGLDRDLVDKFSRRHQEVEQRASEKMKKGMIDREAAEDLAALDGREKKVAFEPDELRQKWGEMAGEENRQRVRDLVNQMKSEDLVNSVDRHLQKEEALQYVKKHSFENSSVVEEHQLLADLMRVSRGNFTKEEAMKALREDKDFLRNADKLWTTQKIIDEEKRLVKFIDFSPTLEKFVTEDYQIRKGPPGEDFEYTSEQKETIAGILKSTSFAVGVNGVAGAGKTTLLQEVKHGLNLHDHDLLTLAPSGKAVDVLREEGFDNAATLQKWIVDPTLKESTRNKVIVVDEAGMISTPQMLRLFEEAKKHNNRIVLLGDTKQIQSVDRGDAFRILQKFSTLKTYQVKESRRQKKELYKDAVNKFRYAVDKKQYAQAWETFEQFDAIQEVQGDNFFDRQNQLTQEVVKDYLANQDQLVIASQWKTIHVINSQIREKLVEEKKLGEISQIREILEPVQLSSADKRRGASYEIGQKVEIVKNHSILGDRGQSYKISSKKNGQITLVNEEGDSKILSAPQFYKHVQIYNERKIEIREGDLLLVRQNLEDVKNGQRVRVKSIHDDGSLTVDNNGKDVKIENRFSHMVHGYAVTSHSSQGTTVNDVHVVGDGMTKEMFYVAATRGRQNLKVSVADKSMFETRVKVLGERKAGLEAFKSSLDVEKTRFENLRTQFLSKAQKTSKELKAAFKKRMRKGTSRKRDAGMARWMKEILTKKKHGTEIKQSKSQKQRI